MQCPPTPQLGKCGMKANGLFDAPLITSVKSMPRMSKDLASSFTYAMFMSLNVFSMIFVASAVLSEDISLISALINDL